jgi:hypothetical protein
MSEGGMVSAMDLFQARSFADWDVKRRPERWARYHSGLKRALKLRVD